MTPSSTIPTPPLPTLLYEKQDLERLLINVDREHNPPCVSVGLGSACGPRRSCVYIWILQTASPGISGTSPRMNLRQIGQRWQNAGLARCTRSSSKPGRKNVSSNAFTRPGAPKALTGWGQHCYLMFYAKFLYYFMFLRFKIPFSHPGK